MTAQFWYGFAVGLAVGGVFILLVLMLVDLFFDRESSKASQDERQQPMAEYPPSRDEFLHNDSLGLD